MRRHPNLAGLAVTLLAAAALSACATPDRQTGAVELSATQTGMLDTLSARAAQSIATGDSQLVSQLVSDGKVPGPVFAAVFAYTPADLAEQSSDKAAGWVMRTIPVTPAPDPSGKTVSAQRTFPVQSDGDVWAEAALDGQRWRLSLRSGDGRTGICVQAPTSPVPDGQSQAWVVVGEPCPAQQVQAATERMSAALPRPSDPPPSDTAP